MRYLLIALLLAGCTSSWSAKDSRSLQRIADALEQYLENHDTRHNDWMVPRVPQPFLPEFKVDTNKNLIEPIPQYRIPLGKFDTTWHPLDTTVWYRIDTTLLIPGIADIITLRRKNYNLPDTLRLAKYSRGCIHRADGTHEYTFWRIVRSGRLTYSYPIKPPKDTAGVTIYNECK